MLQALPALYRMERTAFLASGRMLEASLRADPASSVAHGWLAYWNLLYVGQGWATDPAGPPPRPAALAERAILLDPSDARALTLAGHVRGFLGKHPEEAMRPARTGHRTEPEPGARVVLFGAVAFVSGPAR